LSIVDALVVATFIIVASLEIAVPLIVGYLVIRRFSLSWRLFGLGALSFIIVQIFHTPLVLLIQQPLLESLQAAFPTGNTALALFSLTLGFLAGIFEEPARYAVFRWIFPRLKIPLKRDRGLLFGVGWAGIESIFIALLLLTTMISYLYAAPLTEQQIQAINASSGGNLTEQQIQAINAQMEALINLTPADLLPGLAERMMTIVNQVAWTLMVLAAVVFSRYIFLVVAIAWHTLLDAGAVFVAQTGGVLPAELLIFISTLIAIAYIIMQWRKFGEFENRFPDVWEI
jgi:uncharacterized membrane protein YhfC